MPPKAKAKAGAKRRASLKGRPSVAKVPEAEPKSAVGASKGEARVSKVRSAASVASVAQSELEQDSDDESVDFANLLHIGKTCRVLCRRFVKHSKQRAVQARRALAAAARNEAHEGWGRTATAHVVRDLRRKSTHEVRKDGRAWAKGAWDHIFGRAMMKLQGGQPKYKSTARIVTKETGEGGFGVQCFIIHNSGRFDDFYKVDGDELGAGGSAKVFRCVERASHVARAAKKIYKRDPADFTRLLQEISIMKVLDHPNIVRLFETFEEDRHIYLILELCEGGDVLDLLMQNGQLSEIHTAIIARTVLMTLSYLHSNGYAHRDIKPENILLKDARGDVMPSLIRLVDFGYSCALPTDGTAMSTKVGSPYYLAPEVIEGAYDQRCDLWSIGAVCYLLLCGYPPFAGSTDAQTLSLVRSGKFLFHKVNWHAVSKPAKHLISHLLQVDPEKRMPLKKALEHPWIRARGVVRVEHVSAETIDRLLVYHRYSMLQKSALLAVAFQLETSEVRGLVELFMSMDLNGDGLLTRSEFFKAVQDKTMGLGDNTINEMMNSVDADHSDVIDFTEFLAATLQKDHFINNHAAMLRAFRSFDQDDSGALTIEEIAETLRLPGVNEEVREFFEEADLNEDGILDYGEFFALLSREVDPIRDDQLEEDEADNAGAAGYVQLLDGVPLFECLSAEDLELLASGVQVATYLKGQVVITEGEDAGTFFVLADGVVRTSRDGEELDVMDAAADTSTTYFFGEGSLLSQECYDVTVTVVSDDALMLTISQETFERLVGNLEDHLAADEDDGPAESAAGRATGRKSATFDRSLEQPPGAEEKGSTSRGTARRNSGRASRSSLLSPRSPGSPTGGRSPAQGGRSSTRARSSTGSPSAVRDEDQREGSDEESVVEILSSASSSSAEDSDKP